MRTSPACGGAGPGPVQPGLEVDTLSAQLDLTSAELCVDASRYDRALEALEAEQVRTSPS